MPKNLKHFQEQKSNLIQTSLLMFIESLHLPGQSYVPHSHSYLFNPHDSPMEGLLFFGFHKLGNLRQVTKPFCLGFLV